MASDIFGKTDCFLPVVTKQYSYVIPTRDIILIEKSEGRVRIVTEKGDIFTYQSMKQLAGILEDREDFDICHSYLIINFSHVLRMQNGYIRFDNKESRYLGERSFSKARKRFNEYILTKAIRLRR